MLALVCLCLLLIQANALPHQLWQEAVRENRNGAPMPSQGEPIYPPAPLPESLLSIHEQMSGQEAGGIGVGMGMDQVPMFDPMIPGYIPTSAPFDNPSNSLSSPISAIPSFPDCNVRPQTVVEIQRNRNSASKIAIMMQQETLIMNKRKAYVEQMTVYLNDRITEINKVKQELAQETRWLDLSSNRIAELEEREKLIKLQDVQSCLNEQTARSQGDAAAVTRSLGDIAAQATTVQNSINAIKARMDAINAGASGASGANGAGASTA